VVARALALLALAGCSGKPRLEDAAHGGASRDAGPSRDAAADAPDDAAIARGATGDLQIRVVWPDVPVAARRSPGRTACGTPRAPSVAPTTTWGVPDALVVVDQPAPPFGGAAARGQAPVVDGAEPALAAARLTLADCAVAPRLAVGDSLALTSAVDRPAKLVLRKRGAFDRLVAGDAVPVLLPIAGHTVTAALDAGSVYSVETDGAEPEVGWVAALPGGFVTEANGQVVARKLAAGSHAVTAWLPPRAGQPARSGRGTATIVAGELAELTITLAP
jgi:hypothetical protein